MRDLKALIVDDTSAMRKIVEPSLLKAGLTFSDVFEAGAKRYIRKPFTPDQVRDRVMPLLEGIA